MPDAAVITVSDSRSAGAAADTSGPVAIELLAQLGVDVVDRRTIPDDAKLIADTVGSMTGRVALIVTTGGTGIGPRDVTPEALRPLFERELPGFGEIMRTGSYSKTPLSIISRGGAGVIGRMLVVMLPGSPRGVRECLELIGPAVKHVLQFLSSEPVDCQARPASEG